MRAHLVLDCGGRVQTALLVMPDGQLVPCSQEIRHVATRHVSSDILFEPRITQTPDFVWEDALEALARATAPNFFQRVRRIGLRRPWDQASADALQLAPPLAVLSSAAALVDRVASVALPRVSFALLDALFEPTFAFLADRQLAFGDVEPVVIVPAQTGRSARVVLQKLFRRRGFRRLTIVRREVAAAMALIDEPLPAECVVVDASDDDLHLHRVRIFEDAEQRSFRTLASTTLRGLGWSFWVARIAAALGVVPSTAFDRTLTALLTGSPESLDARISQHALQSALDDAWIDRQRREIRERLRRSLEALGAASPRTLFAGEIFVLDAVRRLFDAAPAPSTPILEYSVRGVAQAMRWLHGRESRRLHLAPSGSLRVNTFHGRAIELLSPTQLPQPGESCCVDTDFRFAGDGAAGQPFVVHLLWGADGVPEGDATLCALPLEMNSAGGDGLRLAIQLRRSRSGRRLSGTVEARIPRDVVVGRAQFTEEVEVRR